MMIHGYEGDSGKLTAVYITDQARNIFNQRFEIRPHGEWTIRKRYTKEGNDDGHGLYCSECDTHLITLSNRGLTLEEARKYLKDHIEKNKFCFNCGADMRKEGEQNGKNE